MLKLRLKLINSETKTERSATCALWCKNQEIVFYSLENNSVGIHPFSFMCDVCMYMFTSYA